MPTTCTTHITTLSQKGVDMIKAFEGFEAAPYLDTARVPTIGYGATYYENGTRVTMKDKPISQARAESLLRATLATYEKGVDSFTRDDINQNQFDALTSFAFNLGVNALRGSTLLKHINAKSSEAKIRAEWGRWVNSGGKRTRGLVTRRKKEVDLYFS